MEKLIVPFEIQADSITDEGTFEGWGVVFNHKINKPRWDTDFDIFKQGAFEETLKKNEEIYLNDKYQVNVRKIKSPFGDMFWLSIKRLDKESIHDWRDLQEIKNLIIGPENEGVELYPSEKRRVDTANQYHLFVLADKT